MFLVNKMIRHVVKMEVRHGGTPPFYDNKQPQTEARLAGNSSTGVEGGGGILLSGKKRA